MREAISHIVLLIIGVGLGVWLTMGFSSSRVGEYRELYERARIINDRLADTNIELTRNLELRQADYSELERTLARREQALERAETAIRRANESIERTGTSISKLREILSKLKAFEYSTSDD